MVDEDSKHLDWTSVEGPGLDVDAWHEVVSSHTASTTLPNEDKQPVGIITVWQDTPGGAWEVVTFTQKVSRHDYFLKSAS